MNSLPARIIEEAQRLPEGTPISAKSLLHLGSRAAIDRALSRLVKREKLMRADRGLYVLPVVSRFGKRGPSTEAFIAQLGKHTGETIVPNGATAANGLRLSRHVPMREVYLTSGRARTVRLGNQEVLLKRAEKWQLIFPRRAAGEALRALGTLGRHELDSALAKLRRTLPEDEFLLLTSVAENVPAWIAEPLSRQRTHG